MVRFVTYSFSYSVLKLACMIFIFMKWRRSIPIIIFERIKKSYSYTWKDSIVININIHCDILYSHLILWCPVMEYLASYHLTFVTLHLCTLIYQGWNIMRGTCIFITVIFAAKVVNDKYAIERDIQLSCNLFSTWFQVLFGHKWLTWVSVWVTDM